MKITSADVFIGGPGKNYVTLKIMTGQGVYGQGDATLNNRETLPAAYLKDYLIPCLIWTKVFAGLEASAYQLN